MNKFQLLDVLKVSGVMVRHNDSRCDRISLLYFLIGIASPARAFLFETPFFE